MYALIQDGNVIQIEVVPFPVHPNLEWIDITEVTPTPKRDWTYDGVNFIPPPPPLPPGVEPLQTEELYDMLKTKGIVSDNDRPRPRSRP